mgnify:CR=1 FL=1
MSCAMAPKDATRAAADTAATGWAAVGATLADYATKARDIGGDIGNTLVGAFTPAENAIGEFVKTGKLKFGDLVTSLIADLAKLQPLLRSRGYSDDDIAAVFHGNWLRFLRRVLMGSVFNGS